ncbi:MAG: hypothetical protein HEP71_34560 [Roseivirga sp.]|nr:hypothetical protein [Roseivirga sp.]
MKNLKNLLLIAVITIFAFSQFTSPTRSAFVGSSNDPLVAKNDTSFQVLYQKITELEAEVKTLNRKLYGFTGSVSLFPTSINDLEDHIDDLEDKFDDLEDDVEDIKRLSSDNSRELNSLESELDDLERSSHSH